MLIRGETVVPAGAESLWSLLDQPDRLAGALPSVSIVERNGDRVVADTQPATGLGTTPVRLELEIADRDPCWGLVVRGSGAGADHAASFEIDLRLRGLPAATSVEWRADFSIVGVMASVGQRVLPELARRQVQDLLRAAAAEAEGSGEGAR